MCFNLRQSFIEACAIVVYWRLMETFQAATTPVFSWIHSKYDEMRVCWSGTPIAHGMPQLMTPTSFLSMTNGPPLSPWHVLRNEMKKPWICRLMETLSKVATPLCFVPYPLLRAPSVQIVVSNMCLASFGIWLAWQISFSIMSTYR